MKNSYESHTVSSYDEEIDDIVKSVRDMGRLVIELLDMAASSLVNKDESILEKTRATDSKINDLDHRVEKLATRVLALRSPMAVDLRFAVSSIKIATILERMGDMAKNSSKRILAIEGEVPKSAIADMEEMIGLVIKMIKNSVKGFGKFDPDRADKVWKREEKLDHLMKKLYDHLQEIMIESPNMIAPCMTTLLIVKNLERMGDYTTNITKIVHYVSSGEKVVEAELISVS